MGDEVVTDLPKVKLKVKAKAEKSTKPAAKAEKPAKKEKPAPAKKASAKNEKKTPAKKAEVASTSKKPAKKAPAKSSKTLSITADSIALKLNSVVSSGKVEAVKVDYASAKSVAEGLIAKAANVLLKAYSDKNIAAITHGDTVVAKAAKEVLMKHAKVIRTEAVIRYVKKYSTLIAKNAKLAEAGKLTATDYRAVTFEL